MSYYDDGRAPSVTGSATSKAAAESVDGNTLREKVYELIEHRSPFGVTDEDIQSMLGMGANTQRPRRRELVLARRVKDSGKRRMTNSGRQATVWVVGEPDEIQPPEVEYECCPACNGSGKRKVFVPTGQLGLWK